MVGKLSAQAIGVIGPHESHLPTKTGLGFFIWLFQGSKHRKRRQVPMCTRFTSLCLCYSYYYPAGQRSHMTSPRDAPLLDARSHCRSLSRDGKNLWTSFQCVTPYFPFTSFIHLHTVSTPTGRCLKSSYWVETNPLKVNWGSKTWHDLPKISLQFGSRT